ncbi:hypothetical protein AZE42_05408 [Rhizopogon vesiculosus]|uniref:Uncharacterized protein n=1 Tax=Rhizopogon vesiculosus TaxID=180088 RepID=A0A1J8QU25_9AGAM|nr:hypothetical protein AZE42_05408 [Rhizopogon vesiculosus]
MKLALSGLFLSRFERSSASRKELFRNIQLRDEDGHVPVAKSSPTP